MKLFLLFVTFKKIDKKKLNQEYVQTYLSSEPLLCLYIIERDRDASLVLTNICMIGKLVK